MRNSRESNELREVTVVKDFCPAAAGSILYQAENTRVICAVSVSDEVPDHAVKRGTGWLTAEYSMLPYSTRPRSSKRLVGKDGRSVEIQRLIGRALRGVIDLKRAEGLLFQVDCDVLQADGGTRTAAITGTYIALKLAVLSLMEEGILHQDPVIKQIAAVSAGIVGEKLYLDLDFYEDSRADVDMNIVMDSDMNLIEIQGTGEKAAFSRKQLDLLMETAEKGIVELFGIQNNIINSY